VLLLKQHDDKALMMNLDIKIARTDTEKMEIYRLRYRVYIQEMQVPLATDHIQKIIRDKCDESATLFHAQVGAGIIASGRVNFKKDGEVDLEHIYGLERFEPFYPDCISTTSRFVIEEPYRSLSFAKKFADEMYRFGLANGIAFDFITVCEDTYNLYKKLGYRSYMENFYDPEWGESFPLVLALHDYRYLEKIKSPFLKNTKVNPEKQRELDDFFEQSGITFF
jgi:hypothetical protein